MSLILVQCTIPAGASISNGVALTAGRLCRIRTPANWTPANVSFQCASADVPAQYRDVYGRFGGEIVISSVLPNTIIALPQELTWFLQDAWLKLKSGNAGMAVPQAQAATFELVLYKGQSVTTFQDGAAGLLAEEADSA